jgi:hypothetical protein
LVLNNRVYTHIYSVIYPYIHSIKINNFTLNNSVYRVSINSFPDYEHLLQEKYVKYFFLNVTQLKKFFYDTLVHFNIRSFCVPRRFLVINIIIGEIIYAHPVHNYNIKYYVVILSSSSSPSGHSEEEKYLLRSSISRVLY